MATCKKSFLPPPCDQLPTAPHDQVRPPPIGNERRAVFVKSEIFDIVGIPVFFFWFSDTVGLDYLKKSKFLGLGLISRVC